MMLIGGIAAGFIEHWWRADWIWVTIALLVVVSVAVSKLGSRYLDDLRRAVGLPSFDGRRQQPSSEPLRVPELKPLLGSRRPHCMAAIGRGGTVIWLMMFKPF